jgi:hypothetical protein
LAVVLLIMGTTHIFDSPERPPPPQPHEPPVARREPAQKITPPLADRDRPPTVRGDDVVVNADPGDDLQKILNEAKAGTTVILADGDYKTGALRLAAAGQSKHWIKIVAAPGAKPRLDLKGEGDFHISGSYVYMEGLEIFNGQKSVIRIASTTHTLTHVYLKSLKLHGLAPGRGSVLRIQRNNANGVGVGDIFVEDSDLSQSTPTAVVDGIGAKRVVLRGNFIHADNGTAAGVTFRGGSSRILIEDNFFKGMRKNPVLILGGRTFLNFFDPQYPEQEGVDQLARNNILVDFDEAAVSFQGVKNAKFLHNTVVTSSQGPIFGFTEGNTNDGSKPSKNQDILIENNLIVAHSRAVYAGNASGTIPSLRFEKQMWIGSFVNARAERTSLPAFPLTSDTALPAQKASSAFENLQWKDVTDIETAKTRFRPREQGPVARSTASLHEVPKDFSGQARSETTAFGAIGN